MASTKLFHIGIKAVIVNNNKALVLEDTGRYAGFDVPGGKIDENETIEQALKRELLEELGLTDFKTGELLTVFEREDYKKEGINLILIFFKVEANNFDVKLSDEHSEYRWISKDDLSEMVKNNEVRNDGVKVALEKVLE